MFLARPSLANEHQGQGAIIAFRLSHVGAAFGKFRRLFQDERPFNLQRWFAVLAFLGIALISATSAAVLSRFLEDNMVRREAVVSMEFIETYVQNEDPGTYFVGVASSEANQKLEAFFQHVAQLPNVVRANVYGPDRRMIWSSDRSLVGESSGDNPELERAFGGGLQVEWGEIGHEEKPEHLSLENLAVGTRFVEAYIPIWAKSPHQVIGVVEMYKLPEALFEALDKGTRLVWLSAAIGGSFLYLVLFWIVHRASRVMREQQRQLVENETMAAVGEMASAVAHGIRNPLAAIRSSAELQLEADLQDARESAADILAEADRLEGWVRDLLLYARSEGASLESVDLGKLAKECVESFSTAMGRQHVTCETNVDNARPIVRASSGLLTQALNCLIGNAIESMPEGGQLGIRIRLRPKQAKVEMNVSDSGSGIAPDVMKQVFKPFFTTKRRGTGLGLPLARRILARYGGTLSLTSVVGRGTTATLSLPVEK